MHQTHLELDQLSLAFSPSNHAVLMTAAHREASVALEWGLKESSGFTMLLGNPGTGKSTLIRWLLERDCPGVRTAQIANPTLSFEAILGSAIEQLGMSVPDVPKSRLPRAVAATIAQLPPTDRAVLILDEAQDLSDETLKKLLLLLDIEVFALQIVLVGQLQLAHRLKSSKLRKLDERIGTRAIVHPMRSGEVAEYIAHRLRAVGGDVNRIFKPAALSIVERNCRGIPRRVNILCQNAMMLAFAQGSPEVTAKHAKAAAAQYDDLPSAGTPGIGFLAECLMLARPLLRWMGLSSDWMRRMRRVIQLHAR